MAHLQQQTFFCNVKKRFPQYFSGKRVLDCGSQNLPGAGSGDARYLFDNCEYIGIDIGPGENVDVVSLIHEYDEPDESFDVVISGEAFEHDKYYEKSLRNIIRLLKSGGLFVFTCATTGRPEHGTEKHDPSCAPHICKRDSWKNYYKNLTIKDIFEAIDVNKHFVNYGFEVRLVFPNDLYFWGIKK